MAINLLSGNLNQYGNAGNYETDPSTWGYNPSFGTHTRSSQYKKLGLFASRFTSSTDTYNIYSPVLAVASINASYNKKYVSRVWVRIPSSNPFYTGVGGELSLTLRATKGTVLGGTQAPAASNTEKTNKTIAEATDTWVQIEYKFTAAEYNFDAYQPQIELINGDGTLNIGGYIDIDQFEVFEYEEVVFTCTLAADEGNINITHETATDADDGSITFAVTGATGDVEYRLNAGAWQASALFSGIAVGAHTLEAREVDENSCIISYDFAIQPFNAFPVTYEKTDESIKGAADGTITLTPTGGTAPYTYSKDGGTTYQAGNQFTGLAPASYAIAVKDDTNDIAYLNITIAQGVVIYNDVFFTRNPIPFTLNESANAAEDNYRRYVEVKVEDTPGSNTFTKKLAIELEPDSTGTALFYLQQAFKGIFALAPPAILTDIATITDRSAVYKLAYGDLYDDLETPASLTETGTYLAVFGGLSKKAYASLGKYFTTYLNSNNKFMTWLPYEVTIDREQEFYLQYFINKVLTQVKLKADIYYDDGTSTTDHVIFTKSTGISYGTILAVPCGLPHTALATVDPAKTISYYDIFLTDSSDVALTDKFKLLLTTFTPPRARYFLYINSLGAYEVLRTTGKFKHTTKAEKSTMQRHLSHTYTTTDQEVEGYNAQMQDEYEYSTGLYPGAKGLQYLKSLRDIMLTNKFYEISRAGVRRPLLVLADSLVIEESDNHRHYMRFKCADPFIENNYTPV